MLHLTSVDLDIGAAASHFVTHGYAHLGKLLSSTGAERLGRRSEDIMLGRIDDPGLFFQHDSSTGRYEDLEFGAGWVGPSTAYRKIERLELDPLFLEWIGNPLFARIARAVLGDGVGLYRAVLWNKAPHGGTELPWHQDDGGFWGLDRPPSLQIWTALDDAGTDAGCVEVLPGSHRDGLATTEGGTVPEAELVAADAERLAKPLPVGTGEVLLIHNHIWHRSRRNTTDVPRRGLGISYVSAETKCRRKRRAPRSFRRVFEDVK